jgi:hypothetical protein
VVSAPEDEFVQVGRSAVVPFGDVVDVAPSGWGVAAGHAAAAVAGVEVGDGGVHGFKANEHVSICQQRIVAIVVLNVARLVSKIGV